MTLNKNQRVHLSECPTYIKKLQAVMTFWLMIISTIMNKVWTEWLRGLGSALIITLHTTTTKDLLAASYTFNP